MPVPGTGTPCGPRELRNRPAAFAGQWSYEVTKPSFNFFVFILFCSTFVFVWMFAFVVWGLISSVLASKLAGKNVPEMAYFVWSGM